MKKRATLGALIFLMSAALPSFALAQDQPQPEPSVESKAAQALDKGLQISDPSGSVKLQLAGVAHVRADIAKTEGEKLQAGFSVPIMRPVLKGQLGVPWLKVFIQPELAKETPKLLDMSLDFAIHDAFQLRVGQFITPFSREFFTPLPNLLFPDFSIADVYFRAGRDTGVMIFGKPLDGTLEYYLGAFNGNGINHANDDADFETMARLVYNPLGAIDYTELPTLKGPQPFKLSLGVDALRGEQTTTDMLGAQQKNTWYSLSADVTARYGNLHGEAEAYYRWGDTPNALGGYAQAGLMLMPQTLELGLRFSHLDPDQDIKDDDTQRYESVLVLYMVGNHLKLQTRYGLQTQGGKLTHMGTLLTQLAF